MIHTMIDGRAHMSGMRRDEDFGLSPPCTRSLLTCATHDHDIVQVWLQKHGALI